MKGKISYLNDGGSGHLRIFRGSKFKTQYCPYYTDSGQSSACGDWCPLFGEPKSFSPRGVVITICEHRQLVFDEFIDEREGE